MIVYKCTCNINDKVYIGVTINSLLKRITQHRSCSKNNSTLQFHNALRKHGFENFSWGILYETNSLEELFALEIYFISGYNSYGERGYNSTPGGEIPEPMKGDKNGMFGKTHTEEIKQLLRELHKGKSWEEQFGVEKANEIKQKLSNSHKGRKNSEETLEKMRKSSYWRGKGNLVIGEDNPNFGCKWGEEKKNKLRGKNNGMYDIHRYGEENGMYNKSHTEETKKKMSLKQTSRGNGNYRRIDNIDKVILLFERTQSIGKTARQIGENYNKVKRELIIEGIITKDFKQSKITI